MEILKQIQSQKVNLKQREIPKEADPTTWLISFLKDRGSARVEVSYYDGSLKEETLIDWIGELERYFEYENIQDPNWV
jgi:hypothetical protein